MAQVTEEGNETDYIAVASETIAGDLRDFVLDRLKHDHSSIPWNLRPEQEQREVAQTVEQAVRRAVQAACKLIAANGRQSAVGSIARMQVRNGLHLQVDIAAEDPLRHALMDHVGRPLLVVLADSAGHMGERGPVRISPDQSSILDDAG